MPDRVPIQLPMFQDIAPSEVKPVYAEEMLESMGLFAYEEENAPSPWERQTVRFPWVDGLR